MDLTFQGANKLVDLVQKVSKIKDPHTRQKVEDALASASIKAGALLPKPETALVEHKPTSETAKYKPKPVTKNAKRKKTTKKARS
jgi:hypothetical protein